MDWLKSLRTKPAQGDQKPDDGGATIMPGNDQHRTVTQNTVTDDEMTEEQKRVTIDDKGKGKATNNPIEHQEKTRKRKY